MLCTRSFGTVGLLAALSSPCNPHPTTLSRAGQAEVAERFGVRPEKLPEVYLRTLHCIKRRSEQLQLCGSTTAALILTVLQYNAKGGGGLFEGWAPWWALSRSSHHLQDLPHTVSTPHAPKLHASYIAVGCADQRMHGSLFLAGTGGRGCGPLPGRHTTPLCSSHWGVVRAHTAMPPPRPRAQMIRSST